MLSELNATAAEMVERLDRYDHFGAAQRLSALVDAVSNWFVRRQPRPLLGRGPGRPRPGGQPGEARRLLDALRDAPHDRQARGAVRALRHGGDLAEPRRGRVRRPRARERPPHRLSRRRRDARRPRPRPPDGAGPRRGVARPGGPGRGEAQGPPAALEGGGDPRRRASPGRRGLARRRMPISSATSST